MSLEDDKTIKRFIIILIIVLLCCVGMYFATKYLVSKDSNSTEENNEVQINNDIAIVGTMLSKPDSEYYVMIYDNKNAEAYKYQSLVSGNKTKLKVYTVDLGNAMNAKFYDSVNTNPKADNISDLRFGDITLIKVKDGKIINSYESYESIKEILS